MSVARASLAIGIAVMFDQLIKRVVFWGALGKLGSIVTLTHNKLGPFSFSVPSTVVIIISVGIICCLIFVYRSVAHPAARMGIVLMLAGGMSNTIDRMTSGAVIDLFQTGKLYWNIADVLICIGIGIVLWNVASKKVRRLHLRLA